MNRSRASITALVIAGAALLAPTVASADAWVTVETNGLPVLDGSTGAQGQPLTITMSGCDNTGGTAHMGEFVSMAGDPASLPLEQQFKFEAPVDAAGTYVWNLNVGLDATMGDWQARWFCSTSTATSLDDPSVVWVSPLATMTIDAPLAARTSTKATRSTKAKGDKAPAATPSTVSFNIDPDALPLVDRMNIVGPVAAKLKTRVDAELPRRKKASNTEYVTAAFKELTGKPGTNKEMKAQVALLDSGAIKVQVVENIALTEHKASWWNKR